MDGHYDQAKLAAMVEKRAKEVERERAAKAEAEEKRQEANRRSRADGIAKEDERRAAVRAAIDERHRAERAAAIAAVRATVETDLRRNGASEADVPRLAALAMDQYHAASALEAAALGDRQQRQAEGYFRHRPAPLFHEEAE